MITDWIGWHEVLLSINHNFKKICHIEGSFFKSKHKKFQKLFFLASSEKKPFKRVHVGAYCPIKAEIRAVDSQSDLRILL